MTNEITRVIDLIKILNDATKAYDEGKPQITDEEWDNLYFELKELEDKTGIIYPNSPTHSISFKVVSELQKKDHEYRPMLSLDKTKEIKELTSFCFSHKDYWDWFAMYKIDGLSCRLTYSNGVLVGAETRGNGTTGEWILHNAKVINSIPRQIPHKDETVIIDGEIICKYSDFKPFENEYKNPRNFAAGSIRLLDASECARRNLTFIAWDLIKGCEDIDFNFHRLEKLDDWGFYTVPRVGDAETVEDAINILDSMRNDEIYGDIPIDGYVFKFESKKFCDSLGKTDHHFNSAIAYKFYDEEYETTLKDIEWTMGRTGVLTPVAIFEPIDINGSTVERASLHNLSVLYDTLGRNPEMKQLVWVAKMNMIIPQITRAIKNDIPHDHTLNWYPTHCPICGGEVKIIESDSGVLNVICGNSSCEGKLVNRIDHYCGKKGLDIKGLSKKTIEKLIDWGWVNGIGDIYKLSQYRVEWISKTGFGEASVGKILNAIDTSGRRTQLDSFIAAIGIPLVGRTVSKEIVKYYNTWNDFRAAVGGDWTQFEGFGPEISRSINNFNFSWADEIAEQIEFISQTAEVGSALKEIYRRLENTIPEGSKANSTFLKNKTFVITGKVYNFKNRDELKSLIEQYGGKVTGSISSKTDYLINNDIESTSSKNKKAKELGIPIITEEEFLFMKFKNKEKK